MTTTKTQSFDTGLLVSVRDVNEAAIAFASNVDIVDIKEPGNGSLGRASIDTIQSILSIAPAGACISVALGELTEWSRVSGRAIDETIELLADQPQIRFAKLGLAGMRQQTDWHEQWANVIAVLPEHVAAVAVAYADHSDAQSPHPRDVIVTGFDLNCGVVLFDTFNKLSGDIFAHQNVHELIRYKNQIRKFGMQFVMAGSINIASLATALQLEPEWVAVRGAVCRAGVREDEICSDAITQLQHHLNQMMKIRISN